MALNPIIKFSTLFGLLAVEISVLMRESGRATGTVFIGAGFLLIALVFVWRSFYAMRIPKETEEENQSKPPAAEPEAAVAGHR